MRVFYPPHSRPSEDAPGQTPGAKIPPSFRGRHPPQDKVLSAPSGRVRPRANHVKLFQYGKGGWHAFFPADADQLGRSKLELQHTQGALLSASNRRKGSPRCRDCGVQDSCSTEPGFNAPCFALERAANRKSAE